MITSLAPADSDQFVGSHKCAECHQDIAETYATHPMSRSAAPVTSIPRPDLAASFGSQSHNYTVENSGDEFLHHEVIRNHAGAEIVRHTMPVTIEIGSGQRGISYVENCAGLLFQSPFTWYPQKETWDLSPGYTPNQLSRFERRVAQGCLFCHVGRATAVSRETIDTFAAAQPITEFGIGCERCHGPGQQHANLYATGGPDDESTATKIVNPAKLDRHERDAVCYQCHLSAIRIIRNGRHDFDFRPGQPLDSVWAVFLGKKGDPRMDGDSVVSHVRQMESSRCFVASNGELSCISCHDPHRSPSSSERRDFYRDRCIQCHSDGETQCSAPMNDRLAEDDSCIECHMPSRHSSDVSHVAQSNHRIPRFDDEPPVPNRTKTGEVAVFRPERSNLDKGELDRCRAIAFANIGLTANDPAILEKAERHLLKAVEADPTDVEVRTRLAKIYYVTNRLQQARTHAEAALAVAPRNELALTLASVVSQSTGDFDAGLKYIDRLMEVNPQQSPVHLRRAGMRAAFGDVEGAIESARSGLAINGVDASLHGQLADLLDRAGESEAAKQHRFIANALRALER